MQPHHFPYTFDATVGYTIRVMHVAEDSGMYTCRAANDLSGYEIQFSVMVSAFVCEFLNFTATSDNPTSATNRNTTIIITTTTNTTTTTTTTATTVKPTTSKSSDVSYSQINASSNTNEWLWDRRLSRRGRKCNFTILDSILNIFDVIFVAVLVVMCNSVCNVVAAAIFCPMLTHAYFLFISINTH